MTSSLERVSVESVREAARPSARLWVTAVLIVATAALGASCAADDSSEPGSDVGAAGTASDASADLRLCRSLPTLDQCRLRSDCTWVSVTCDDDRVVAGCSSASEDPQDRIRCSAEPEPGTVDSGRAERGDAVDARSGGAGRAEDKSRDASRSIDPEGRDAGAGRDAAGSETGAEAGTGADAGSVCEGYQDEGRCADAAKCRWWVGTCDGYVVREECVRNEAPAPPTDCDPTPKERCHLQSESSCYGTNCSWVAAGCGGGTGASVALDACLPSGPCSEDADCPARHTCASVWVDPCHDQSCTACGAAKQRCVPAKLLSP